MGSSDSKAEGSLVIDHFVLRMIDACDLSCGTEESSS